MTDLLTLNEPDGAYPKSYYAATAHDAPARPALEGAHRTEVCVVGGGFAGLSAAINLAERGREVMLVEANRIGWGASGRNGGQVNSGQRLDQPALRALVGAERARALWEMGEGAKAELRRLVAENDIACDLKWGHISGELTEAGAKAAWRVAAELRDLGYDAVEDLDRDAIASAVGSEFYAGGVMDRGAGHLHPLNYALGLARAAEAKGARLFERSRVRALEDGVVRCEGGEIRADHVILAMNGYHGDLEPEGGRRVMPINNFIVATEPLDAFPEILPSDAAVADSKFVVNYFRKSADNRLLFGGGETYRYRYPGDIASLVRGNMAKVYPQLDGIRIDHAWGGTLGITLSRLPCFRAEGRQIFVGGFSGHGVAMATMAGHLAARWATGDRSGFELVSAHDPGRFPGGKAMRHPLLVLAMTWYALRDRLGV